MPLVIGDGAISYVTGPNGLPLEFVGVDELLGLVKT